MRSGILDRCRGEMAHALGDRLAHVALVGGEEVGDLTLTLRASHGMASWARCDPGPYEAVDRDRGPPPKVSARPGGGRSDSGQPVRPSRRPPRSGAVRSEHVAYTGARFRRGR
jgi:hypothetical protein